MEGKVKQMDMAFLTDVVLPVVFAVVGVALIWALVELVITLRRARKTVETVEEQTLPILNDVKDMTESLKPAVDKVDPLVERVSLAVDAANLEIMRLDGILENVDQMTKTASNATAAVDTVANAPLKLVNAATDKLRSAFSSKKASDDSVALGGFAEERSSAASLDGSAMQPEAPTANAGFEAPCAEAAEEGFNTAAAPVAAPDAQTAVPEAGEAPRAAEQEKYFTYAPKEG